MTWSVDDMDEKKLNLPREQFGHSMHNKTEPYEEETYEETMDAGRHIFDAGG